MKLKVTLFDISHKKCLLYLISFHPRRHSKFSFFLTVSSHIDEMLAMGILSTLQLQWGPAYIVTLPIIHANTKISLVNQPLNVFHFFFSVTIKCLIFHFECLKKIKRHYSLFRYILRVIHYLSVSIFMLSFVRKVSDRLWFKQRAVWSLKIKAKFVSFFFFAERSFPCIYFVHLNIILLVVYSLICLLIFAIAERLVSYFSVCLVWLMLYFVITPCIGIHTSSMWLKQTCWISVS